MIPRKTRTTAGGSRMAYVRARRSQAMCMNTAMIRPALSVMNSRIRLHLR
jgi:hypothetical protein